MLGVFGEDPTLQWINPDASLDDTNNFNTSYTKSSSFSTTFNVALDTIERQQLFNNDPFLYAIVFHKQSTDEGVSFVNIPVNFACIDCSCLSIEQNTVVTRSQTKDGERLDIEINSDENLIPSAGTSNFNYYFLY